MTGARGVIAYELQVWTADPEGAADAVLAALREVERAPLARAQRAEAEVVRLRDGILTLFDAHPDWREELIASGITEMMRREDRAEDANRMASALMANERFDFMQDFSIDQVKAMMRAALDALYRRTGEG